MTEITILGADVQAAASLAGAYPERAFVFVSDQSVVDGWDLSNVQIRQGRPGATTVKTERCFAFCPRWLDDPDMFALSSVIPCVESQLGAHVLPVKAEPRRSGSWIAKGDRWHKPDAPVFGPHGIMRNEHLVYDCGIVFQPLVDVVGRFATIGFRESAECVAMGVIALLQERFFWQAIVQAGETVDHPQVASLSLQMLDLIEHKGFFTLNWIETPEGLRLSSFRPVPLAVFDSLRRAGLDLLTPPTGVQVAAPGVRFVGSPHYSSYSELGE